MTRRDVVGKISPSFCLVHSNVECIALVIRRGEGSDWQDAICVGSDEEPLRSNIIVEVLNIFRTPEVNLFNYTELFTKHTNIYLSVCLYYKLLDGFLQNSY